MTIFISILSRLNEKGQTIFSSTIIVLSEKNVDAYLLIKIDIQISSIYISDFLG